MRRNARIAALGFAAVLIALAIGGCADRPRIGVTVTNAPTIPDCIQGSATKPCPQ